MTLEQLKEQCRTECAELGYDHVTLQKVQGVPLELRASYRGYIVGYYTETGWERQPPANNGQYERR